MMKLVYSISNKLYYIINFLDYSSYKKIHYDVFRSKKINLHSTEKEWQECLHHGHKNYVEDTQLDINYAPLQKIKILLENNPFHKVIIKDYKPKIQSMSDGTGINWHDDSGWKYGITYYINRRWNRKFGGEFLFADKYSNGFIPLMGNSIVILKAPLCHKVSPVQKPIVSRKTIQIFIDNEKKNDRKNI